MAFQLIVAKDFATFATGTASLVSNGFTPLRASIYAVTNVPADFQNDCVGTPTQTAAFRSNFLMRSESHQNMQVVFDTGALLSGLPSANQKNAFYHILRFNPPAIDPALTDCYILGLEATGFLRIYTYTGGSFTAPSTVVGGSLVDIKSYGFPIYQGHSYVVTAECWGINPTILTASCYDVAAPDNVISISVSDSTAPLQSGPGTYGINIGNLGDALPVSNCNFKSYASYFDGGFSATEKTLPANTATTIHLVNSEATWTPGTPGAPSFTVTGHASQTATQVVDSTSTAHLTVLTTTPGLITITAGGFSTTVAVVQTVAFTDPNVSTAPYAAKLASLSTNYCGPYFKVAWGGTRFDLNIDNTHLNAAYGAYPNTFWPYLRYSLDGGEWTDISLHDATSTTGAGTLAIVSGLSVATHTLEFEVPELYVNGTAFDIWNTPNVQIVATGFTIDGSTVALPTSPMTKHSLYVRPKNMIVFTDSIGIGVNTFGAAGGFPYSDATVAFPSILKEYLNAEMGNLGFQGQGYVQAGLGNVPALTDTWDNYYDGATRLVNGLLDPPPDYIVSVMGQNDASNGKTNTQVIDAVQELLPLWRAAAPDALMLIVVPLSGAMRSALSLAVSEYLRATSDDDRVILIDLGTPAQTSMELGLYWVTEPGRVLGASEQAVDGIHATPVVHGQAAARIAAAVSPYANSPPGGVGFRWTSSMVFNVPGQRPWLYFSRADLAQVAVLSTQPPPNTTIAGMIYEFQFGDRAIYKRGLKVKVFGTGAVTGGTITVTPDAIAGKAYAIEATTAATDLSGIDTYRGILFEVALPAEMTGFLFNVRCELAGTDIEITDSVALWDVYDTTP